MQTGLYHQRIVGDEDIKACFLIMLSLKYDTCLGIHKYWDRLLSNGEQFSVLNIPIISDLGYLWRHLWFRPGYGTHGRGDDCGIEALV